MGTPKSRNLRIAFLLLSGVLLGAGRAGGDTSTTTLKTELEDLQEMKSRLLVDFPAGLYGLERFVYVENRRPFPCGTSSCVEPEQGDSGGGGRDPILQPQEWAVGFSSALITAGPVSLRGILAQLYNPLAHGPDSTVFSEPPDLSLNIDLEVAPRRGIQLGLIPGHWSLLCIYKKQFGAQLGSAVVIPLGRSLDFALVGLLSSPPHRLEHEQSWYAERPLFPGGLITHLAGSLTWEYNPLRFTLVTAAAAGRLVSPGTVLTLDFSLSAATVNLALLFGFCSPRFFTPEGDTGDLEWIAAARGDGGFGPIRLSAACSKELHPLPPFPAVFRVVRDRFEGGIEFIRRSALDWVWKVEGEVALQREWSAEGRKDSLRCLQTASTLAWRSWSFKVGMDELQDGESEPVRDVRLRFGHDPAWGKIELEAGYRLSPISGFHLTSVFDVTGENKRFYIRVGTEDVLTARALGDNLQTGDWLELCTLRVGWEASTDW